MIDTGWYWWIIDEPMESPEFKSPGAVQAPQMIDPFPTVFHRFSVDFPKLSLRVWSHPGFENKPFSYPESWRFTRGTL